MGHLHSTSVLVPMYPGDALAFDSLLSPRQKNKNSSGDEIANVYFFLQHRTCRGQRLRPLNEFVISTKHLRYLPTHQTDF